VTPFDVAKHHVPAEPVKQTAASADDADEARCGPGTGLLNTAVWALVVPSLGVVRPGAGTPASVECHPETRERERGNLPIVIRAWRPPNIWGVESSCRSTNAVISTHLAGTRRRGVVTRPYLAQLWPVRAAGEGCHDRQWLPSWTV
jgi:hypothetical protein